MIVKITEQIAVILILLAVGYYARRRKIITEAVHRGLSVLVVHIGIPAFILSMVALEPDRYRRRLYFITVLISLIYHLALFYLVQRLAKKIFQERDKRMIAVLLVTFSNCMFLGFPVLRGLYGEKLLLYGGAVVVSFNLVLYSLGLGSLQEKDGHQTPLWKRILTPFNLATAVLIFFLYTGLRWPSPVQTALDYLSAVNTPLSLLVIGSSLAVSDLRRVFTDRKIYFISLFRCLLVPLAVLFILRLLPLDPDILRVMVVLSAMPSAANNVMLAEECRIAPTWAAMAVTQTTLLFMPVLLFLIPLTEAVIAL